MHLDFGASSPIKKRTIDDCYGTDCYVDMDYYDNSRNIHLLASINDSVAPALPEIIELMSNATNHNEVVSLMQNQQETLEKLVTMQYQNETLERLVTMLSSMMSVQQDTRQHFANMTHLLQRQLEYQIASQSSMMQAQQDTYQQLVNMTLLLQHQLEYQVVSHQPLKDCSNAPFTGQYTISPEHGELNPVNLVNPFPSHLRHGHNPQVGGLSFSAGLMDLLVFIATGRIMKMDLGPLMVSSGLDLVKFTC